MSNFIDIKMKYNEDKSYFDLNISETGDLEVDQSFDTNINCSILTDGRASDTEVYLKQNQRGSIVDLFTNNPNGSKLWLLEQSRADLSAKNRAIDYIRNSLNFLIEEGFVKNIFINGNLTKDGILIEIIFERFTGVFDKYKYSAWNNSLIKVI